MALCVFYNNIFILNYYAVIIFYLPNIQKLITCIQNYG